MPLAPEILPVLSWISAVFGGLGLCVTAYLGFLALLAGRPKAPQIGEKKTQFAVVVPAHNEEQCITATVKSLLATDWPSALKTVVVVADNCSDTTAQVAIQAGARVLEREHATLRGKGYALELAFDTLLEEGEVDAIAVVDADTLVSANLLSAFAVRMEAGELAAQAEYGVSNPGASWRTKLMTVALAMFHGVRSIGREKLGLSSGLRGNGMCFSVDLLKKHPHKAYGLVEDVEYGIAIGLQGVRVAYAYEAEVQGEMVSSGGAAASQRRRWEGGRSKLLSEKIGPLLKRGLFGPSAVALDLAMDLLVPPLSYVGLWVGLGVLLEAALFFLGGLVASWSAPIWGASIFCLALYVLRGVQLSGQGLSGLLALFWAPVYVVWKIVVVKPWRGDGEWVRTQREGEQSTAGDQGEAS